MQTFIRVNLFIMFFLLLNAGHIWAKTLYVVDQIVVNLRDSAQGSANTIAYLKTDTPVELLEEVQEYYKVKTSNGEIGFIRKNFLTTETPKELIIKQLRQENGRLKSTIEKLEKRYEETFSNEEDIVKKLNNELQELQSQNQNLLKSLNESNQQLIEVTQAHETLIENSQNVVEITQERNELKTRHTELSNSVERLTNESNELKQKQTIRWFLAGAGVLFLGWILGKLSRQRRRSSL